MGLSPHGLQRVRKPTLRGPSPPWSPTQPAGGTAPCCSAGVSGRARSQSLFQRLHTCRTIPLPPRRTSSGWPDTRGAGVGGGSGTGVGIGGERQRPAWRRGRPGRGHTSPPVMRVCSTARTLGRGRVRRLHARRRSVFSWSRVTLQSSQ